MKVRTVLCPRCKAQYRSSNPKPGLCIKCANVVDKKQTKKTVEKDFGTVSVGFNRRTPSIWPPICVDYQSYASSGHMTVEEAEGLVKELNMALAWIELHKKEFLASKESKFK